MPVWRIRDRSTFMALRADGTRGRSGPVSVTVLLDGLDTPPRLAFAIGTRTGPAVVRNRLRRQLRPIVAGLGLPSGAYLVGVSPAGAGASAADLRQHLVSALARSGVTLS